MTKARTGRRPLYTDAQVLAAVAALEDEGAAPTAEAVKRVLVAQHGVSDGINAQSLSERVADLVEARDRERRTELILALPPEARERARALAAQMEAGMLEHLALSYDGLRAVAAETVLEREADLRIIRQQLGAAEAALAAAAKASASKDKENEGLREALEAETAKSDALRADVDTRDRRISDLERQLAGRDEMVAFLREVMRDRAGSAEGTTALDAGAAIATASKADGEAAPRAGRRSSSAATDAGQAPHLAAE